MTFDDGCKAFPVVYCDGEREFDLGILMVDPFMNIKNILSNLSHKIGIPLHQFSVYLADKNSNRKMPFTTVPCDGDSEYIYVKRFRRSKKCPVQKKNLSEKLMHLRRDGVVDGKKINGSRSAYAVAPSDSDDDEFKRRLLYLYKEGDPTFLMRMNTIAYVVREVQMGNGGGSGGEGGRAVCKECLKAEVAESDAGFHRCIRDVVVVGFRTTAGPISRPARMVTD